MSLKEIALVICVLMFIQMLVIIWITKKNADIFDSRKALKYPEAISDLAKTKPKSALAIRLCYAACVIEVLVMLLIKYSK